MASPKQPAKELKVREWEELYCHYRDMSKATGAKRPSESQEANAFWGMKPAKDRSEVYYDPARKEDMFGRTRTPLDFVGRAPQRPNHSLGKSIAVPGEPQLGLAIGSKRKVVRTAMACSDVGTKILQEMWEGTFREGVLALPGPVGQCAPAHGVHLSERPGEVWVAWRALFLPYQEGAGGGYKRRVLCLCGSAQGVCAAGEAGSSGSQSPV